MCEVELNYRFIIPFSISMFCSVMIFGHTTADMEFVNDQILQAFDIAESDKQSLWFLKNMMPLGLAAGSTMIYKILQYERHVAFIGVNLLAIGSCMLSVANKFEVLIAGRFLYGMSAGIHFGLVPKMLTEYLSIEEFSKGYGLIPNLAIEIFKVAFVVFNIIYMFIKEDDSVDKTPDWYWRFNFGLPIIFLMISTVLFGLFSRKDSFYHIMTRKKDCHQIEDARDYL